MKKTLRNLAFLLLLTSAYAVEAQGISFCQGWSQWCSCNSVSLDLFCDYWPDYCNYEGFCDAVDEACGQENCLNYGCDTGDGGHWCEGWCVFCPEPAAEGKPIVPALKPLSD